MSNIDFIPAKESELDEWLKNMKTNIDTYSSTLAIPHTTVDEVKAKIDATLLAIDNYNQQKVILKSLETIKTDSKKDTLSFLREQIARWKTEPLYTEAIGDVLRIIGSKVYPDPHTYKPKLTSEIKPGHILLNFVKAGVDAVNIYYRIKGATDWKFLARDTHSPYSDSSPLEKPGTPEVREYMAIGVVGDTEFGLMSDIISAVYDGAI